MAGLTGMKRITEYLELSETTVLKLHRQYRLPMRKIGGLWMADTDLIESWRRDKIAEQEHAADGGELFKGG